MLASQSLFPHSLLQLNYLSTHSMKFPLPSRKFPVTTATNSCSPLISPLIVLGLQARRRKEGEGGKMCSLGHPNQAYIHIVPLKWETQNRLREKIITKSSDFFKPNVHFY